MITSIEEQFNIDPKELGNYLHVNEAYRQSDNKHVVVKTVFYDDVKPNSDSLQILLGEFQLIASIKHPKCLELIAFTLTPIPKTVTPYMKNGTLYNAIMKKLNGEPDPNFTPTKMMCSIYGICSTMKFLHDINILNGSLISSNIYLDDNYDICIANFGLSHKINNIFPLYAAPDTYTDEYDDIYTNKIDVYTFGVLYMQYFTKLETLNDKKGKIRSPQNFMMRVSKGARFIQPDGMNDDQYEVYLKCTDLDRDGRPSFDELCKVFETMDSLLFDDVDKEEYKKYINECKKLNEDENQTKLIESIKKKKEEEEVEQSQEHLHPSESQKISLDIDRYKIVSRINKRDSFNSDKFYRVKDSKTNKIYAAKVSKSILYENIDLEYSPEILSIFREVNLMSFLDHPSVIKFINYYPINFNKNSYPTIIMELCTNGSLREIIDKENKGHAPNEWTITKKLINIFGIASGMSYLHAHNIIHRDLKLESILIDDYFHPKISDFEASKTTDFLSESMNMQSQEGFKGTSIYIAPEVLNNEKYSKAGDVYSFAYILYEIMTCEKPFKDLTIFQIMKKTSKENFRPDINDDVPKAYRELIQRCWSQEPEKRPSFDEIVELLKTDRGFITELVDESEFYKYVNFIDECKKSFDIDSNIIHFEDFLRGKRIKEVEQIIIETDEKKESTSNSSDILQQDQSFNNDHQENISKIIVNIEEQFIIDKKESEEHKSVNEAYRKSDNKHVVIKEISDYYGPEYSIKLLKKLRNIARIKHPKCLELIALTLTPVTKIITPYMRNGALDDAIMKKLNGEPDPNFTPTKMMCSIYGICSTMKFLHDINILHGFLNPSNIYLDDNYDICIANFGLSYDSDIFSMYAAPDFNNDEYDDTLKNKIDVYSFGILYMQYFTKLETLNDEKGKIESPEDYWRRSYFEDARFIQPDGMNDDQYKVYLKCTDKNRDGRPSFDELCEIFETRDSLLFDGVDKEEYKKYINECKKLNEDEKQKDIIEYEELNKIIEDEEQKLMIKCEKEKKEEEIRSHYSSLDIDRYSIISEIGSNVYRVKDSISNEFYAAKISLFMTDIDKKQNALHFFREVNFLSLLDHPSVVKFINYYPINFDKDPCPTIIMELCTNGSLREIINMESQSLSPIEWTITKKLINIYGIASGMSYLHAHNIIHRDLKLESILIDDYFHPKISDFGVSKTTDFLSESMNMQSQEGFKGTIAYMAPEVLNNEKYSKAGDVYSFAYILYEIMTCEKPFKDFTYFKLIKKIVKENFRPDINDDVPKAYRELIQRCWSQEPEKRPSFDEIVELLKTDREFITELVDESEFYNYVNCIDECKKSFDVSSRLIHFEDFLRGKRIKDVEKIKIKTNEKKSKSHRHRHHKKKKSSSNCLDQSFDISQYEIINKIGEGSFGKVFRVRDKQTGTIYAAKVTKKSLPIREEEEEDALEQLLSLDLQREVNNSYKFNHPAIVKFIGFSLVDFSGKNRPVMIIEFVSGGSLKNLMDQVRKSCANSKWDDTKKLIILYGIASAMNYLHSNNVIHRDLKPDNILMDEDLNPKIADFGLSKTLHSNKDSMSTISHAGFKGTFCYSSPEAIEKQEFTKAGDVYAFALIAYEIMTHEKPYDKLSNIGLFKALALGERPAFNSPIPEPYQELIESCWSQDPSNRPTFAEIMDKLKNDDSFIIDTVDESVFLNYVDYIDEYPTTFKKNKIIPTFKEFCKSKNKKKKDRKKKVKEETSSEKVVENNETKEDQNLTQSNLKETQNENVQVQVVDLSNKDSEELFATWEKLFYGKGVSIDQKGSLPYVKAAAEKGHVTAMFSYATMLSNGCGTPLNPIEASIYFKKAADEGHVESMHIYATMKNKGMGIPIDKKESLDYFKKAADCGHIHSMYKYSMMLNKINSSSKDVQVYCKKAADCGLVNAMFAYAKLLTKLKANQDEIKKYYKMAADNGHVDSMFSYADMLSKKGDKVESANYFKLAADNGCIDAMTIYADMLNKGIGVVINKKESKRYIQMAKKANK